MASGLTIKLLPTRRATARVALPPLIALVTALPARSFVCRPQVRALSESTQAFIRPRINQVSMAKRRNASSDRSKETASAGAAVGASKRSKKVDFVAAKWLAVCLLVRCYSPRSHTTHASRDAAQIWLISLSCVSAGARRIKRAECFRKEGTTAASQECRS